MSVEKTESHGNMIVSDTEGQVEIKNVDLEPQVIYQNWMFFLFEIL